jgi:hypothetical protein
VAVDDLYRCILGRLGLTMLMSRKDMPWPALTIRVATMTSYFVTLEDRIPRIEVY